MHPILIVLLTIPVILLSVPFFMGVWSASGKLLTFLQRQGCSPKTSFVITLCLNAVLLAVLAGPARILGLPGYLLAVAIFVTFIAIGAPHAWRLKEFLRRELNTDPTDDVEIKELPKADDKNGEKS